MCQVGIFRPSKWQIILPQFVPVSGGCGPGGNAGEVGQASAQKSPRWAGNRKDGAPGKGAGMEQNWEVASRTWGERVRAKVLQAGKEAEDLQTELMSTDLGWALREVRSDSFFNLFFSSRGNLS